MRANADYAAGMVDSIVLTDAVDAYVTNRLGELDAAYRFNVALARLSRAIGAAPAASRCTREGVRDDGQDEPDARRIGAWIGAAVVALSAVAAAGPPMAEQLIRRGIDDALGGPARSDHPAGTARAQRIARLRQVADRLFDWPEMSQRCLGPAWRTIDDAQRKQFTEVFPDILASAYLDDLDKFRGDEQVTIERSTESGDHAEVHTIVVTHGGERVPMVYWLHRVESAWRVYDFSIEGVSLVNNYRESFSRFLVNHKLRAAHGAPREQATWPALTRDLAGRLGGSRRGGGSRVSSTPAARRPIRIRCTAGSR